MDAERRLRTGASTWRAGTDDARLDLDWRSTLDDATDTLLEAAALDLDDYFEFEIERVGEAEVGAGRGARFRARASVGATLFEQLLIDVGIGQAAFGPTEELITPDLLAFAGIEPTRVPAAPLEQHLAEKLHAYTRRYGADEPSSRPKDLIDMVLISELASFEASRLRRVIDDLFTARAHTTYLWSCLGRLRTGHVPTEPWQRKSASREMLHRDTSRPAVFSIRCFAAGSIARRGTPRRSSGGHDPAAVTTS